MPFTWRSDLSRPLRAPGRHLAPGVVLERIERELARHGADVQRGGDTLHFQAGPLRVGRARLLSAISSGKVVVGREPERLAVRYELRFTAWLAMLLALASGVLLALVLTGTSALLAAPAILGVLVLFALVSVPVAAVGFFNFLCRILDSASERDRVSAVRPWMGEE